MNKLLLAAAALAATSALAVSSSHASELLTNGSFETGDFTGWTQGGNTGFTGVTSGTFDGMTASDGSYFAYLGPVGSDGTLSQTFSDVAGATYLASFDYASDGGTPNDFAVSGPGSLFLSTITDDAQHGFVHYTGFFTGSGSDTITFTFRNDPGYDGLDNVSVLGQGVPEPATWAVMLLGMGLAGGAMRRRRAIA